MGRPASNFCTVFLLHMRNLTTVLGEHEGILDLNIGDRFVDPGGAVGEVLDHFASSDSGEYEDGAQAALHARDDVGVHAIADHDGFLGMGVECAQGCAHHQRVWFAYEVGFDACGGAD
jgi:hypothetical protein